MADFWSITDFERTIRDFEFTRKAVRRLNDVVYSADFEDMDAAMIFRYLLQEMELVSFKDYLKRYIYERAGMDGPFDQVPDSEYREIIAYSFEENSAPHSFEPTTRKWSATVKGWLTQDNVKRETVFLLGFGLRMDSEDVSEFLTKVLKESDFDPLNPSEVIYRYCYDHHLRYSKARQLLEEYAQLGETAECQDTAERLLKGDVTLPAFGTEEELLGYLTALKMSGVEKEYREKAYQAFISALDGTREIIARMYTMDSEETGQKKEWTKEDISPSDVEKIICSGIPVTGNGNLQKMSSSVLSRHFSQHRMSRQRIESILKKQFQAERFDLITLLFFIHSQKEIDLEPEVRCASFLDEANEILKECRMMAVYPVNPYESFILMCLLSEVPLATYSEIWEMSYQTE